MLTKFSEAIGSKLADRWATVAVPALLFWFFVSLAWIDGPGGTESVQQILADIGRQPVPIQAAVLIALLLLAAASGELVAYLTLPALRVLEGYWGATLERFRAPLVRRVERRVALLEARFQQLAGLIAADKASPRDRDAYVRLDQRLRRFPRAGLYQPTRVGNILRAAESRPADKYGLEALVVWPHLWLLLPATVQSEIAAAYQSLAAAVGAVLWGLLLMPFGVWAWWAPVVGLLAAILAYRFWVLARAETFADLVEAAFDLYRARLYTQLRWPLPPNPAAERAAGRQVTIYIWRGLDGESPAFTVAEPKSS
jgi:hypothetical protein